jgi:hypothetical protein
VQVNSVTSIKRLLLTAAVLTLPNVVQAGFVSGLGSATFNAGNGSVVVTGGQGVMSGCIDWFNGPTPPSCPQPDGTMAAFTVNSPATAPFAPGQTGHIQDLNFAMAFPLVDFINVGTGSGTVFFDLKDLRTNMGADIGSCTQATGDLNQDVSCTPSGSPFTITNGPYDPNNGNTVDTVTISLTLDAYGYIGNSGTNYDAANRYVGIFSTQQAVSGNIDSILATIRDGGSVSASWSAAFSPVNAPEPGTFGMLGLSLVGGSYFWRRRMSKR